MNNTNKVAIGVGVAGTVAAIAGAYYFYGSDEGARRRKHLKSWMVHMKAEVMDKLDDVQELNGDAYDAIVTSVAEKYKKLKNIDPKEVVELATRLHAHWKDIRKDIEKTSKQAAKIATKGVKKAVTKKRA